MDSFDQLLSTTTAVMQHIGAVQHETGTKIFDDLSGKVAQMNPPVNADLGDFLTVAALVARLYRSGYSQRKRIPTSVVDGLTKQIPKHCSHRFGVVERMITAAVLRELGYDGEQPEWRGPDEGTAGSVKEGSYPQLPRPPILLV